VVIQLSWSEVGESVTTTTTKQQQQKGHSINLSFKHSTFPLSADKTNLVKLSEKAKYVT